MQIHVGKLVDKLVKESGMTYTDFAKKMNYSKQNINTLLNKDNWLVKQIWDASVVLKVNIFKIYVLEMQKILDNELNKYTSKNKLELLKIENEFLKKQIELYKIILG
jgi:hypothetical protein